VRAIKIIGAAVGGVIVLVGLVLAGTWFATAAPRAQAEAVLAAARAADSEALAPLLHPALLEKAAAPKLLHMLRGWGLHEPGELGWREWQIGTEGARLQGAIVRADGVAQELSLRFVRHEGQWKLLAIDTELAGIVRDPLVLQVPTPDELVAMLARVTRDFGAGVRAGSLGVLHASMARSARARYTVEEIDAAFAQFIAGQVEVDRAAELTPLLSAPAGIDPHGVLVVSGHYPSRPVLSFEYRFLFEEGGWRLASLLLDTGGD
jgi:hypothetical protein